MTTQEDRSLGSGVSFPKWMKNRINDKFDFDQTASSPTELDDSFMYYFRHPPGGVSSVESKMVNSSLPESVSSKVTKPDFDFSRHPPPCQRYLQSIHDITGPPQITPEMKLKSPGTDDGFKGEAAKCGTSIIRVASQIVSGKIVHDFTLKQNENCDQTQTAEIYDVQKRRGSKSLPASPIMSPSTSPKANRKVANKYFMGAYTDTDKAKGWILSNLLARRDLSHSVGYIGEETKEDLERAASTASIDDLPAPRTKTPVYKPKPSELREMNFWSPTSL